MTKSSKVGWGAARPGKTHSDDGEYKHDGGTNPKSSKDLRGLYGKYQGKVLKGGQTGFND